MVNIQPVEAQNATYSAVKIRVNDAKAYNFNDQNNPSNGIYNATDIEVNKPVVYTYPNAKEIVTYAMTQLAPVKVPKALPVPEPNLTTVDKEKELAFHGINFKGDKKTVEIVPPVDIKPEVDVPEITNVLKGSDYDAQTMEMLKIVKAVANEENINDYIVPEIFESLIGIIKADNSSLEKPSSEQNAARAKVIEDIIALNKAISEGADPKTFKYPSGMTKEEREAAVKLTPFEQAERNKSYALSVTALLAKEYADNIEKQTGNVVPLTDLPGASAMVDVLRKENNPDVKMSAIDSMMYISRPQYKEEISTVLNLVMQDKDPMVGKYALMALEALSKSESAKS